MIKAKPKEKMDSSLSRKISQVRLWENNFAAHTEYVLGLKKSLDLDTQSYQLELRSK